MGVIADQTIKGTIYSYLGAVVGFVNTGLLFPMFFSTEQIGLVMLLVSLSMIFSQLFGLGFTSVTNRLFPVFNDKNNHHNGFTFLMLSFSFIGILIFMISFYFSRSNLIAHYNTGLFIENMNLIIPIVIMEILFRMLNTYSSVLLNSVIGALYKEIIARILITVAIILYIFNIIDFHTFLYGYISVQIVPVLALFKYLIKNKELSFIPKLSFINVSLRKSMIYTAVASLITGFSALGYQYIDKTMIGSMLNLSNIGVYSIAFFFGSMIELPSRSLRRIASVIIAKAWHENNVEQINDIYKKSSIAQTVIGLYVLIGIIINIDDVINILGEEYYGSKMVFIFLSISFFIHLFFGISSAIITNSKYFKLSSYFMVLFLFVVIATNYLLIPMYGISGAALASSVSVLIFAIIKFLYLLFKFKMQPFNIKHLFSLIIGVALFMLFYYFPIFVKNPYFNIILKSIIFSVLFMISIYTLKLSADINGKIDDVFKYILTKF